MLHKYHHAIQMLAIVLSLLPVGAAAAAECATSKCYTDAYESVDAGDLPVLARVQGIFRRLSKTIGAAKTHRAKLLVIEAQGYPWAVALSDNTVVLTTGAIRALYDGADLELADARTAFVLGHELSHLVTDDLFHHRAFSATRPASRQSRNWQRPDPANESRADFNGYLYATLSGYQTSQLIAPDDNFFDQWLDQLGAIDDITHPRRAERAQYIRARFSRILEEIPYYKLAVMLAHFGHYKDAQMLFEDFLNNVETQHAYSNLGYVYLQRAREEMPDALAYKYWIPTLLEPGSGLQTRKSRSLFQRSIPDPAIRLLTLAQTKLKLAVEMNEDDLASHINLAAAYLYLPNKIHRAYASIEDARNTTLGRTPSIAMQLESVYQLIRVADDDDDGDRWSRARDILTELSTRDDAPENILYNLSRMLDDRGRDSAALQYWRLLQQRMTALPRAYQIQVCVRLALRDCHDTPGERPALPDHVPELATLPIGKDIRYPDVREYLQRHWPGRSAPDKQLEDLNAAIYSNPAGDTLMILDHYIEMLVKKIAIDSPLASIEGLVDTFGQPIAALPTDQGFILSYRSDWSALVVDSRVVEIWLSGLSRTARQRE